MTRSLITAFVLCAVLRTATAGVLPEDRADAMLHSYDGGGVTIQGPSLLVRKQFAQKFSASANYYVDKVNSASIDVITTASPYSEERTQTSVGLDYLHDRWVMNIGFTNSEESDYSAETFSFGISQDIFGDLTTVSLGYSLGNDVVRRRGDTTFSDEVQRQHYRLGLSQILTKNLLLGLSFESITDEGFLNNPYRQVRYVDTTTPQGYSYEPETYPRTRTSDAGALRLRYYLPYRAAIHAEYRKYGDTWAIDADTFELGYSYEQEIYPRTRTSDAGALRLRYYLPYRAAVHAEYRKYGDTWAIDADTFELGYTHPIESGWVVEAKLRFYSQEKADFYSDLFPSSQYQNFMGRDKELSTFASQSLRLGLTYDIVRGGWKFVERGTVNLIYDHLMFDYDDFRDLTTSGALPGQEPLYSFDANVFQVFVSFWF